MNAADFDKLSEAEKEHFFQCSRCGKFVDRRELRDVIFHETDHKPKPEFLKEHRKVEELTKDFQATVAQLTARLDEQESQIQKVSAQVEADKPAPQVVNNR